MKKSISRIGLEMMLGTALILSGIKFAYKTADEYPKMLPVTGFVVIGEESSSYAVESERNYEQNMKSLQDYKRKVDLACLIGLSEIGLGSAIFINLINNKQEEK